MLNQRNNEYYLRSMGIVQWRERGPALLSYSLKSRDGVLTLIARSEGPTSALQQQLWENILKAVASAKADDTPVTHETFLVFGHLLAKKITAENSIVTYSLAELVDQPQYKANVWNVIKNKIVTSR